MEQSESPESFSSLPYLPAAADWMLSIHREQRRVDESRIWRVYEALHAYEEISHSYLELIHDYAISHLAELRERITEAFGDAESAYARASTALRQFAMELSTANSGADDSSDVGGGGVLTEPQRRADSPRRSPSASSLSAEQGQGGGLSNSRSPSRRSRSRSRSIRR